MLGLRIKTLRREDYPSAPAWFDALLFVLNQALGDISGALSGGLTFTDNHVAELKTIEVKMPAEFPTWHLVGGTGEPAFQNSWANHAAASAFGGAAFRMWPNGDVELRGIVARGTIALASTIFTLPGGYRPPVIQMRAQAGNDGAAKHAEVRILTDGQVSLDSVSAYSGSVGHLSLHGIRFQANGVAARPDSFAAPFPLLLKTGRKFGAQTCSIAKVVDKTAGTPVSGSACAVDWQPDGAGAKVNAIWGLQPGRTYDVTFLLTAG